MKKLLLLGAMLVLGATSFSASEIMTDGQTGSASLTLKAQGVILDANSNPVLVVEPREVGGDTGALVFNFNNLDLDGGAQVLSKDFVARVEVDGAPVELKTGTTMTAKLSGGTAGTTADGNVTVKLTENGTTDVKEIGTLVYSHNFDKYQVDGKVMGYQGNVIATVTPTAAGTFINSQGSITVAISGFTK